VSYKEPLSQHAIAISISESPDMAVLGLGKEHLDDAMTEVARHLLAMGARLLYGGDLRKDGFSNLLFELVSRHRRDADLGDERTGVKNYLAWPVHVSLPIDALQELTHSLKDIAELVCLTSDGAVMMPQERAALVPHPASAVEWAEGLTAMRKTMRDSSNARIVLGGRTENYKGRMPGVAEEALIALESNQPLYLLGGFGGCTRDVAADLGLIDTQYGQPPAWAGRDKFTAFKVDDLRNGLTEDENRDLATTAHIDQAVTLILRGLLRQRAAS
jgi:hypothetical protein